MESFSMRSLLLDVAYTGALIAASPFLAYKLRTTEKYRIGLGQRFGDIPIREGNQRCLWIHAASVGEVQAARPLVKALREMFPDLDIAISTQTQTGQDLARSALPDCIRFYYPIDLSRCVRKALDRIRPDCIALVEREIWPNFAGIANRRGIPVVQVNGRLSESSLNSYRWLYPVIGETLQTMSCFVVQAEEYAEKLRSLSISPDRIRVAGNLKYDGIPTSISPAETSRLASETGIPPGTPTLVCGSIHPDEVSVVVQAWEKARADTEHLRLLLVPRHLERVPEIESIITDIGHTSVRKTAASTSSDHSADQILIADTMGELRGLYALASVVVVGGTFNQIGGHNVIEPAALGKPVLFGPSIHGQRADARTLIEAGGAIQCHTGETLAKQVCHLFNGRAHAENMGLKAQEAILSNFGAAQKTVEIISQYLSPGECIDE